MDCDTTDMPAAYYRGRNHGPEVLDLWMNVVSSHLSSHDQQRRRALPLSKQRPIVTRLGLVQGICWPNGQKLNLAANCIMRGSKKSVTRPKLVLLMF
jgi:hypothetical protein